MNITAKNIYKFKNCNTRRGVAMFLLMGLFRRKLGICCGQIQGISKNCPNHPARLTFPLLRRVAPCVSPNTLILHTLFHQGCHEKCQMRLVSQQRGKSVSCLCKQSLSENPPFKNVTIETYETEGHHRAKGPGDCGSESIEQV